MQFQVGNLGTTVCPGPGRKLARTRYATGTQPQINATQAAVAGRPSAAPASVAAVRNQSLNRLRRQDAVTVWRGPVGTAETVNCCRKQEKPCFPSSRCRL